MPNPDLVLKATDYGYQLSFIVGVTSFNGAVNTFTPYNLINYTSGTFEVWVTNTSSNIVTGAVTIASAAGGVVLYLVQPSDFTTAGIYSAQLSFTNGTSQISTFPMSLQIVSGAPVL